MAADRKYEFIADKEKSTLTIKREFGAEQQIVWDFHTKSELLDKWFAPKPLTTSTSHMDFRSGGYWHYAMITPEGDKYWNRLDYISIDAITGYSAMDGFCDASGVVNPGMPRSKWEVTFSGTAGKISVTTKVIYASADDLQKSIDMGLEAGMASTMERLDELLPTPVA